MNPILIKIGACVLLLTVLQSCKEAPGTWVNNKIATKHRAEFHQLNDQLLGALKSNNTSQLENIMSREFLESSGKNRQIELCSIRMREGKNYLLDEYYMVHPTPDPISVKSFKYDINSYTISYNPLTRERYLAFFTVQYHGDKWLLTAVYNKYKYGWKVDDLELNPYTVGGKTAPELFKQAQQEYDKHYLVNAMTTMQLSRSCALPSVLWRYDEQEEMDEFYSKIGEEADNAYTFPIVVKQLPTKPAIIKIFTQNRDEGVMPNIYYISKVSLNDTLAVKKEHDAMKKVIGLIMPGIDKGNKYIHYTVFNKMPDWQKKNTPQFDILDKY
ncbi:hypothetical protein MUGA111182_19680 [Mucilaginibacter galii]|uniref:Uncharacterized protein n=1 Tax=Mucilaginibacter galii TaxID=2005073 RepID=A0A917N2S0_9SPHI|nr:hypothetical protein [Mucilaginibacter galii]GGI51814.1 hypothetical protein GCM10011425_30260 [Mucilaginibacter galii]